MKRTLMLAAALLGGGLLYAWGQNNFPAPGGQTVPLSVMGCLNGGGAAVPCSSTDKLPVDATVSVSASIAGFAPAGTYATLTATDTSADVALPSGATVVAYNTGTTAVSCILAVGAGTATASKNIVQPGSWMSFVPESNTHMACIDQTGAASNVVVLAGGSGLPSGSGGGSSGGSGGASSSFDAAFPATGTAIGIWDGTNMKAWLAGIALADGVNGNNTAAVAGYVWNGTTWDRMPGTTDGVTVRNPTAANLNATVVNAGTFATQSTVTQATASNLNATVVGPAATGAALAGNPVRVGMSDGTNTQNWLAGIALGDGVNGNNTGAVAGWVWNGTTWDRMPGTTAGVKTIGPWQGATGSAVPSDAIYTGINVAGNTRGMTGLALGGTFSPTVAIVDGSGNQITAFGGSGGTASNFGSAFPTPGTAIGFTDGTNMVAARVGAITNVAAATNFLNTIQGCQYNATPVTVTDTRYQSQQCDVNGKAIISGMDTLISAVTGSIPAGTAIIGKTGIDQTTPGTTNAVFVTNTTTAIGNNADAVATSSGGNSPVINYGYLWNGTTWDRAPGSTTGATVKGSGAAGTAATGVVTVQGIASMTPLLVTPAANSAVNVAQVGGTAVVADPCQANAKSYQPISQATSTQLFAGTSAKKTYVCSIMLVGADAENVSLISGTGTVCATNAAAMIGGTSAATGPNLAANGGFSHGNGASAIAISAVAADNVCLMQSGSGRVAGVMTYVSQ